MAGCGGGGGGGSVPTPTPAPSTPAPAPAPVPTGTTAEVWLTTPDQSALLTPQTALPLYTGVAAGATITVDATQKFQQMVGFGASLTDAAAYVIQHDMSAAQRDALLADLFGPQGNRFNFTRLTLGASDFSASHYSYDDQPKGQTDVSLAGFSIAPARADVLPTARAARALNPDLAVMATPWSPPGWMKTTDSLIKGTLKPEYHDAFARYLTQTVQAFAAEGVPIDYLSLQNEPDFEPDNYPGMRLSPQQRISLVGDHVGPALRAAGLATRLLELDHNWDLAAQATTVLADTKAAGFIAGVAWHCYRGDVSGQSTVHDSFPGVGSFFTECTGYEGAPGFGNTLSFNVRTLMIGATRNWAQGVLLFNAALDQDHGPHLGGCADCRGVVTVDKATGAVTRNAEFYALGHLSRFVQRGARRIASTSGAGNVLSVAFENPDGTSVLLAYNNNSVVTSVVVNAAAGNFSVSMPAQSAATFRWK
ncbi:MAG: glycosyl hydrolase [Burkholderiales bacterium]|nr:glycosyl hydrolase [Burkholderiales bacterium]